MMANDNTRAYYYYLSKAVQNLLFCFAKPFSSASTEAAALADVEHAELMERVMVARMV